ncbi:MAG: hypothetical protein JNJ61_03670 [Anaerolineae bacterium]|nr:hypothetical protein [Anaerolineae bacterium]
MQSGPHHILEDSLPDGRDFPARVDDLLAALPALLNLTPTDLDYSAESLRKIERKLKRLGFDKCLQPPIFPAVVAYLGEMMRRQIPNSTWKTRLHEDGKTWEPWVVDPQGRVCNPWMDLYDDLAEGPMSLGNIPYSRAASRQLPPPGFWEQVERKG